MQMTHFDVIYFFCHITCLQENSKTSPVIQRDVFSLYVQVYNCKLQWEDMTMVIITSKLETDFLNLLNIVCKLLLEHEN